MKKIICFFMALSMILCFVSCVNEKEHENEAKELNIYVLTGPTGIGAVNLWEDYSKEDSDIKYNFYAVQSPDEIVSKISNGEADIAAISTNLASKLYNKTDGAIKISAVNTLGVLNVLDNTGAEIRTLADVKGRKIFTTGQGSNPEYIIKYLLTENGIDPETDVTIEFKAEGSELAAVWATEPDAVIIAPQPVATSVIMKYEGSRNVLDLTDEWKRISPDSELMMGCLIVRTDFLEKNKKAVDDFMKKYEESVKKTESDAENTAQLCEKYGIVPKAAIAAKAIPYCNICCISAGEAGERLNGYLSVLFEADPSSVGGKLPDDGFWYKG